MVRNRRVGGTWWRAPLAVLLWAALAAPLVAGVTAAVVLRRWAEDLPEVPDLAGWRDRAPATSRIVAADGTVLAELPFVDGVEVGHRAWVELPDVPRVLIDAVLAAEDAHFYEHHGVDYPAIARAALANHRAGRIVEGASTIPQQLARNLLPEEIGSARELRRKVREALLARQLERRWSKAAVLEVYLNFVFLGNNAYGVAAAARAYFDVALPELSAAQAALLAGLIQAPSRLDPVRHLEAATARRDEILARMQRAGFLPADAARAAAAAPVVLRAPRPRYGEVLPWYTEAARRLVAERWPEELARGGLTIETAALPAVGVALAERADQQSARWPTSERLLPELAGLWWDLRTGYVEAVHGGQRWSASQFDRTTQACRQPGSAWKLLVYGAALEAAAITPGTPLLDAPVTEYDEVQNVFWKPKSGNRFRGVVLAEDAFASSLNAPAIDVLGRVGGAAVIAFARRLGVTSALDDVGPLALGASCVRPDELARAYAVVLRGGWALEPHQVVRVRRGAQVLFDAVAPEDPWRATADRLDRLAAVVGLPPDERVGAPARGRLLDERIAYQLRRMLRAVVERGTSTAARRLDREVLGKTGTTNDNTDAWFVGASARMLGVAWLGFDDPRHNLGPRGDGAHAALPWWLDGVRLVEGGRPPAPILGPPPAGMEAVRIDRETGLRARVGGAELWFREGSAPTAETGTPSGVAPDFGRTTREF
ncbi:MAG: transglycosylase domain-containing protein [Kofleriaceae bacterium]